MRVESPDDRQEQPEECDFCGWEVNEMYRTVHFGPGHNVNWTCALCYHTTHPLEDDEIKKHINRVGNYILQAIRVNL